MKQQVGIVIPDVKIRRITHDSTQDQHNFEIDLLMRDEATPKWYGASNESFNHDLEILVGFTTEKAKILELQKGNKRVLSQLLSTSYILSANYSNIRPMKRRNIADGSDDLSRFDISPEGFLEIPYKQRFVVHKSSQDVAIFAVSRKTLPGKTGVFFYGQIFVDYIKRAGGLVRTITTMKDQRGKTWEGEVDVIAGKLFRKTDAELLTKVESINYKLHDYDLIKSFEKIVDFDWTLTKKTSQELVEHDLAEKLKQNKISTNSFLSVRQNGTVSGVFYIDMSNISILFESLLPKNEVQLRLERLALSRFRNDAEDDEELIGLASQNATTGDLRREGIQYRSVSGGVPDKKLQWFSFTDSKISEKTFGKYEYRVDLSVSDSTKEIYISRLAILRDSLKSLEEISMWYENKYQEYSERFVENDQNRKKAFDKAIMNAIEQLVLSMNVISGGDVTKEMFEVKGKVILSKSFMTMCGLTTGTKRGLLALVNFYGKVIDLLERLVGSSATAGSDSTENRAGIGSGKAKVIDLSITLDKEVDAEWIWSGYKFDQTNTGQVFLPKSVIVDGTEVSLVKTNDELLDVEAFVASKARVNNADDFLNEKGIVLRKQKQQPVQSLEAGSFLSEFRATTSQENIEQEELEMQSEMSEGFCSKMMKIGAEYKKENSNMLKTQEAREIFVRLGRNSTRHYVSPLTAGRMFRMEYLAGYSGDPSNPVWKAVTTTAPANSILRITEVSDKVGLPLPKSFYLPILDRYRISR